MKIFLPFHIPKLVKSLPFYIPKAWKRYPFRAEPPRIGHYREYPPPREPTLRVHRNVYWSKKPKCAAKYGVHHTKEHTWPMEGNWKRCMCNSTTILRNAQTNNLLFEFPFHRQPKPWLFIPSDSKCGSAICKAAAFFKFLTRSFLQLLPKTLPKTALQFTRNVSIGNRTTCFPIWK